MRGLVDVDVITPNAGPELTLLFGLLKFVVLVRLKNSPRILKVMRFGDRNRPFDRHIDIALGRPTNKTLAAIPKIGIPGARSIRRLWRRCKCRSIEIGAQNPRVHRPRRSWLDATGELSPIFKWIVAIDTARAIVEDRDRRSALRYSESRDLPVSHHARHQSPADGARKRYYRPGSIQRDCAIEVSWPIRLSEVCLVVRNQMSFVNFTSR